MTLTDTELFCGPNTDDGVWEVGVRDYATGEAATLLQYHQGTLLQYSHAGTQAECLTLLRAALAQMEAGVEMAEAFRHAREALHPLPFPPDERARVGQARVRFLALPGWRVGSEVVIERTTPQSRLARWGAVVLLVSAEMVWLQTDHPTEGKGYVLRVPRADIEEVPSA